MKITALAGSLRAASFNKALLAACVELAPEGMHIELHTLHGVPPFNEDDEKAGTPEAVERLRAALGGADGLLVATPEYNAGVPGVLKNAIDWASRPEPNEPSLVAFKNKIAGLVSASPGNLGGVRGLAALRSILTNIGVIVIPTQLAIARASDAFEQDGSLKDERQQDAVASIGAETVSFASRLFVPS